MGILAVGFGEISTLAKTRGSFLDSFCFWALFTKVTGGKGETILKQVSDFNFRGLVFRGLSGILYGFLNEQFSKDLQTLKKLVEDEVKST